MVSRFMEIGANRFCTNSFVWKDIYIPGLSASSNFSVDSQKCGGVYHYRDSGQLVSVCRNRFIVWRSQDGYLELTELSWDTTLSGNAVRLHIPSGGGPLLSGVKIFELASNVVILFSTSSIVFRLVLPHPETISKDVRLSSVGKGIPPSVFMFAVNESFSGNNIAAVTDSTTTINGSCSSSWCTMDGNCTFIIGTYNMLYCVILPSPNTTGFPERYMLDQQGVMQKLWNILPTTSKNIIDQSVVCLEVHGFGGETVVISLCNNATLKLWSMEQKKCVLEHKIDQYLSTDMINGDKLMMQKSYENISDSIRFAVNYSSEICIFDLMLFDNQLVLQHVSSCFITSDLSDIDVKDFSLTNEFIWVNITRNNISEVYHCNYETDCAFEKALLLPVTSYDVILSSYKDPRESYLDILFDTVSSQAICKGLKLYGYKYEGQSIRNLKETVICNIEQEIRAAARTNELTDSEYTELVVKCWNKFYNCCVQYEQLLWQPLGISCDPCTGMVTLVYHGTLSFFVPYTEYNTSNDYNIILKCIDLIHRKLSSEVFDSFINELSCHGNLHINIKDIVNAVQKTPEFCTEFKLLCGQIIDLSGTLNDIIQFLDFSVHENGSNDLFLDVLDIYSNSLACQLLAAGLKQICLKRLKFCCDLLLFYNLTDQLMVEESIIDIERLLLLIYNYHLLFWLANTESTPPNRGFDINLGSLYISESSKSYMNEGSLIELYLMTMGRGYCSKVLSDYQAIVTKQQLVTKQPLQWTYLLPQLMRHLIQFLWPQDNSLHVYEFLLSKCQYGGLESFNRYCHAFVDNDKFSRHLLMAYSYIGSGLPNKSISCFCKAYEGVTSEKYLERFCETEIYWIKVMRFLEDIPYIEGIVQITQFAVNHYSYDFKTTSLLWSNLFKYSLQLCQYNISYNAIISNPDEQRCKECLRHFVTVLTEFNELELICSYNYHGLEEEVVIVMEMNARNNDSMITNYYNLLFSYHMSRDNFWKAAQIKYEQGYRLSVERSYEGLLRQKDCYITSWNLLKLLDSNYQWIIKPSSDKKCNIVTINELNKDCYLLKSKLLLIKHNQSLKEQLCNNYVSANEVCSLLIHSGLFDNAIQLSKVFNFSCVDILEEVTSRCISLSANIYFDKGETTPSWAWLEHNKSVVALTSRHASVVDQSWQMLRQYLLSSDKEEIILLGKVVNKLLSYNCHVPEWITDRLKMLDPAQLLKIYISYNHLDLATSLAIDYIDATLGTNKEHFGLKTALHECAPSVWLPHNIFDQLISYHDEDDELMHVLLENVNKYLNELENCSKMANDLL